MEGKCPGCGGLIQKWDKELQPYCHSCHKEPIEYIKLQAKMSNRDQMAAAAMGIARESFHKAWDAAGIARRAYEIADAMLAEREKPKITKVED